MLKRTISFILIFALVLPIIVILNPRQEALAEGHVHTAACYPAGAVCHTVHTDSCYSNVSKEVECGGFWIPTGEKSYKSAKCIARRYFCTRKNYCDRWSKAEWARNGEYEYETYYVYQTQWGDYSQWQIRYSNDRKCPECDKVMNSYVSMPAIDDSLYMQKLVCSECGAVTWDCVNDYEGAYRYAGKNHSTKTVTERTLTCTKQIGKWYVGNTEVSPTCGYHIHTADCYLGELHSQHTDGCYAEVEEQRYCSGTFEFVTNSEALDNTLEIDYRCGNSSCYQYFSTDYWNDHNCASWQDMRVQHRGKYYYQTLNNDAGRATTKCPECGKTYANQRTFSNTENVTTYIYKCSKCGKYAEDLGGGYAPRVGNNTHGYYKVKTRTQVCTRELGKYYIANADGTYTEGGCVCDKVITGLVPTQTNYQLQQGDTVTVMATATFLNGTTKTIPCSYQLGTGAGQLDMTKAGVPQSVTVSATSPYLYSYTAANKTPMTATVTMTIFSTFPVGVHVEGNGSASINNGGASADLSPNDPVTIKITPNAGHHIVTGEIYGYPNADSQRIIFENVYSPSRYTDGVTGQGIGTLTVGSGGSVTYQFSMPRNNVSLNVSIKPNAYEITYNPNGGNWSGSVTPKTASILYGDTYDKVVGAPPNPKRDNHIFAGWFTDPTAGTKIDLTAMHLQLNNITLYAHWTYAPDETVTTQIYDDVIIYLEPVPVAGFTYNLNTFWRVNETLGNGTGTSLTAGSLVTDLTDRTYYGHWTANAYKITFNANGGTFDRSQTEAIADRSSDGHMDYISAGSVQKTVLYHAELGTLPTPTRSGYTFAGWKLPNGKSASDILTTPGDLTLIAEWISGAIPEPSYAAFSIAGLTITDANSAYDPKQAIPSTETIHISGTLSPWDFLFGFTTINGVTKITSLTAYGITGISWNITNSAGESCLNRSVPTYTDLSNELTISKSRNGVAGMTTYMTSDYSATTGIKIVRYDNSTKSDEIYINGVKVTSLNGEMYPACTYNFSADQLLDWTAANDTYTLSYSLNYELLIHD